MPDLPHVKFGYLHIMSGPDYDGLTFTAEWIEDHPHPNDPEPISAWWATRSIYEETVVEGFDTEQEAHDFNALSEGDAYAYMSRLAEEAAEEYFRSLP